MSGDPPMIAELVARQILYGAKIVGHSVSCGFAAGGQDRPHACSAAVLDHRSDVRLVGPR
jgi:hypothetical protein